MKELHITVGRCRKILPRSSKLWKKQLEKLQKSPYLGEELGNKNGYDLSGYRKMYVNKKQIRIVYSIKDEILVINVISIGKREDMDVYANAADRTINE